MPRSPSCSSPSAAPSSAPSGGPSPAGCHLHVHDRYVIGSKVNRDRSRSSTQSRHTSHLAHTAEVVEVEVQVVRGTAITAVLSRNTSMLDGHERDEVVTLHHVTAVAHATGGRVWLSATTAANDICAITVPHAILTLCGIVSGFRGMNEEARLVYATSQQHAVLHALEAHVVVFSGPSNKLELRRSVPGLHAAPSRPLCRGCCHAKVHALYGGIPGIDLRGGTCIRCKLAPVPVPGVF
ncbi:hypothetical protein OH77DRAFT_1107580 [Trametes cingulata]|nr:hypothetical protein OH77DRAFT_1107580 [Trametes cingulata]